MSAFEFAYGAETKDNRWHGAGSLTREAYPDPLPLGEGPTHYQL